MDKKESGSLELSLVPLSFEHAQEIFQYATPEIMRLTRTPYRSTLAETQRWIKEVRQGHIQHGFVIMHQSLGFLGMIHLTVVETSGSFYFWLAERYWGNGFASEAVGQFVEHVFDEFRLENLFTSCLVGNKPSLRILNNMGFNRVQHTNPSLQFFHLGLHAITHAEGIDRFKRLVDFSEREGTEGEADGSH